MPAVTIRDVPDDVRAALAEEAHARGQSLQAFLLGLLAARAEFSYNRDLMIEIGDDLRRHRRGARDSAPPAGDLVRQARRESGRA